MVPTGSSSMREIDTNHLMSMLKEKVGLQKYGLIQFGFNVLEALQESNSIVF